ncbi:TPA: TerC/Alx family metal homeostasis membrane protein [Vibrio parahaemolyticus]|uniref:TerC/Alx family metal homeostasis membrane protein n=1 Tax=Vibrio parahaemolyticus TaxID=670 RepID=UPI00112143D1|nr:TerC/Alx family metal homeostasis membrane protein [Vibrio parahaemolyticus]EJI1377134.1 TerC/Alx family metal homeostasis membrane protein [Vibrio parahaemolyticus]ELA7194627.1 TerC/Alx family metal homeostasis membrane protein [Vibrio parahaemolyticus]MDF4541800.1 TerC/Alx family metal homeostasis membrane protein [Vibrio parahaemolyticus]MDG2576337.1 TerC/Alx family metal homeostasis membrane protein [Vibrio parahaemolyticus]MDG2795458.1 TerC/Alx family metal homeostasis membrane protein
MSLIENTTQLSQSVLFQESLTMYGAFGLFTLVLVALDIYQTRGGAITMQKAIVWSIFWFLLAFLFAGSILFFWDVYAPHSAYSNEKATVSFLTGYLLEKSLSVDNLFVFAIIFAQYKVPEHLRPRALLWGVIGALLLRAIMIAVGAQLLAQYHWVLYLFAAFLIWTGIKLARDKGEEEEVNPYPEQVIRKLLPVTDDYQGNHMFLKQAGTWVATPMLIVVGVIAVMDVMFALDSIPAIFAVTREPFLVLAANVFALLGLRSLYFVLQAMLDKFIYLKPALSVIMMFIGVKMLLVGTEYEIPTIWSLTFLILVMTSAVVASVYKNKENSRSRVNITNQKY